MLSFKYSNNIYLLNLAKCSPDIGNIASGD